MIFDITEIPEGYVAITDPAHAALPWDKLVGVRYYYKSPWNTNFSQGIARECGNATITISEGADIRSGSIIAIPKADFDRLFGGPKRPSKWPHWDRLTGRVK